MKIYLNILFFISFLFAQTLPILPDSILTPGDTIQGALQNICKSHYTVSMRKVSRSLKKRIFERYGILDYSPSDYEVDHLISLELGGSNNIKNLWPQSYKTQPWNAHKKDRLENRLRRLVCIGKLTLQQAQYEISHNWIEAYQKYIIEPVKKAKTK